MLNLQEQMEDIESGKKKPVPMSEVFTLENVKKNLLPEFRPKEEIIKKAKATGTGLLTGTLAIPSDVATLSSAIASGVTKFADSPTAMMLKGVLQKAEKEVGREVFDKWFTKTTGIESNPENVDQMIGEIVSPTGAFLAPIKTLKKVFAPLKKGVTDFFDKMPPPSSGLAPEAAGVGQLDQTKKLLKDEQKTITTSPEESVNAPTINKMSMAGFRSTTGKERFAEFIKLERAGELNKDQLFEKTGVYRGEDGKPRMEINTSSASIDLNVLRNLNKDKTFSLYQFFKFDKLYQEYPDRIQSGLKNFQPIRNVKVNFKRVADVDPITGEKKTSLGFYNANKDSITVNLDNIEAKVIELLEETPTLSYEELYKAQLESNVLHEIQHAIQYREGFLTGANSKQFLPSDFQVRKEKFEKEIEGLTKETSKDQSIIKKLKSEADALTEIENKAHNAYRNTYGEREATLVQKRFIERLRLKGKKFSEKDIEIIMSATKIPKSMQGTLPKLNTTTTSSTPTKINEEELSPLVAKKLKEIDYMGPDAFHATTKDFKTFGFVSKNNEADIGFHVGSKPNQASARVERNPNQLGARTLPLKLKRELKPARIPDLSSFKEPSNWLRNIAVSNKDPLFRVMNDTPEGRAAIKKQIEDNIPIKIGDQTYYIQPDLMKGSLENIGFKDKGIDKNLWKDLVLESTRAIRTGLDTTKNFKDRQEWFDTIKKVANKNGYDSYIYRNEYEGQVFDTLTGKTKRDDSYMLLETDQAKGKFGGMTKGEPDFMKNQGGLLLSEGGNIMKQQMELFEEGGLKDEGNTIDPVSGNEVPPGSNQEEVRDDIPAQLSEGEFVFPADVVRYIGLEKLMVMRQEAKAGLARMEEMGQMGNSDEATLPDDMPFKTSSEEDDMPFTMEDLDTEEETEYNRGGVVYAQSGTFIANNPNVTTQQSMFQNQNLPSSNITQPVNYNVPNLPAPVGGFTPKFSGQVGQAGQQGTTPTFQTLLGRNPGQYDEMREYRNEAGMKLNIPFKNGEPIYPIPEGYSYVDPEATKTEEVTTKEVKPQTARVMQEEGGDDGDNKPGGAVDLLGDPLSYKSIFNMDKLDTALKDIAVTQGMNIFNVKQQVLEKGILGQADVASAVLATQKMALNNFKNESDVIKYMKGNKFNLVDLPDLERDRLGVTLTNAKEMVKDVLVDKWTGKTITMKELNDKFVKHNIGKWEYAKGLNWLNKADRKAIQNNRNDLNNKIMKLAYIVPEKEKEELKYIQGTPTKPTDTGTRTYTQEQFKQSYDPSTDYTEGFGEGVSGEDIQSGEADLEQTGAGYTDTSTGLGVGAKGGFFSKSKMTKQKPKVKNMKRGGLASR